MTNDEKLMVSPKRSHGGADGEPVIETVTFRANEDDWGRFVANFREAVAEWLS